MYIITIYIYYIYKNKHTYILSIPLFFPVHPFVHLFHPYQSFYIDWIRRIWEPPCCLANQYISSGLDIRKPDKNSIGLLIKSAPIYPNLIESLSICLPILSIFPVTATTGTSCIFPKSSINPWTGNLVNEWMKEGMKERRYKLEKPCPTFPCHSLPPTCHRIAIANPNSRTASSS